MKLLLLTLLMTIVSAIAAAEMSEISSHGSRRAQETLIYTTPANFELTLVTGAKLLTAQVFQYESIAARLIYEILKDSPGLGDTEILMTTVDVRDQTFPNLFGQELNVWSSVVVTYIGQSIIADLSPVLRRAFSELDALELLDRLIAAGVVSEDTAVSEITFTRPEESEIEAYFAVIGTASGTATDSGESAPYNKSTMMIAFFLLAGLLLLVSIVLVIIAGDFDGVCCCLRKRRQRSHQTSLPYGITESSSETEENPEDIVTEATVPKLGAKRRLAGIVAQRRSRVVEERLASSEQPVEPPTTQDGEVAEPIMTPTRGVYREYEESTPGVDTSGMLSPGSSILDVSTSSRAPLGIMSMNKLHEAKTPDHGPKKKSLYDLNALSEASP